jgi:hypothetical protein
MRKTDAGHFVTFLSDDITDPTGAFLMHAVICEQLYVQKGIYTRIQSSVFNCWLHGEINHEVKRDPARQCTKFGRFIASDLAKRMSNIEWDGAMLLQLTGSPERMFDDAFIVTVVPRVSVNYVNFCTGIIPVLLIYVRDRATREISSLETMQLTETLAEFADWMAPEGQPDRTRQKILRNMGIVEMLVEMLQVPFAPFNTSDSAVEFANLLQPRHRNTKRVADAVYKVLAVFLEGDSRKNELYISRHIGFFQTQIGGLVKVENMYIELVLDNSKVIANIHEEEIMQFIDLLKRIKSTDCLRFLAVLCECEGVPICHNQTLICDRLLGDPNNTLVYMTEINPGKNECEVSVSGRGDDWVSLRKMAKAGIGKDGAPTKEYAFLLAQLNLFGDLCSGRNQHCIDLIANKLKYLSWRECFHCVTDDLLLNEL